ncbi:uncharacterized protein BJX67DRAFT_383582 [Aspergillus lucknowensis]|uniref:Uncharacterized protein n=1 Tax=Aspergillus lucknowensis TaxID=176173 RepID=A0ABR4LJM6_9EURO
MECIALPPEQLALALAIVKAKPVGLDIKEYILQTREFIKASKNADVFQTPEKFFDSVGFWKRAYEKSEAEQGKLLDKIYELEERNEALIARVRSREDASLGTAVQSASESKATRKRAKTELCSAMDISATATDIPALDNPGDSRAPFMRQIYVLRKALQKRWDCRNIAQAAVNLCERSANEIKSALPQQSSGQTRAKPRGPALSRAQLSHLELTLYGVESAMSLLLQALKKLTVPEPQGSEAGLLTIHIVRLYETTMNVLEQYCKIWAHTRLSQSSRSSQKLTTRSARAKARVEPEVQSEAEKEGAMQLASFLNRMLTSLGPDHLEQRNLMEGFLCVLLTRVGKLLSVFAFQDLELRPDLRTEPSKLPLPPGLVGMQLDDESLEAARTEAKHVIWLLERSLGALSICSSVPDPGAPGDHLSRTPFISGVKAKLQSTLARAVFGDEVDYGPSFERPSLPKDIEIDKVLGSHEIPELSAPEWYIQEVWRLIGWEVLMEGRLS